MAGLNFEELFCGDPAAKELLLNRGQVTMSPLKTLFSRSPFSSKPIAAPTIAPPRIASQPARSRTHNPIVGALSLLRSTAQKIAPAIKPAAQARKVFSARTAKARTSQPQRNAFTEPDFRAFARQSGIHIVGTDASPGNKGNYLIDMRGTGTVSLPEREIRDHIMAENAWLQSKGRAVPAITPAMVQTANAGTVIPDNDFNFNRYQSTTGNFFTNYDSKDIDIDALDANLAKDHVVQDISGANCNCWMRASWLSALLQADPAALKQRLLERLGPGFRQEIDTVVSAAIELKQKGAAAGTFSSGRFGPKAEAAIPKLSQALLLKEMNTHGLNQEQIAARKATIAASTVGGAMGETDQIAILMHDLGVDMVVLSKRCSEHQQPMIEVSVSKGNPLDQVAMMPVDGVDKPENPRCTNARTWAVALAAKPVLIHTGQHFELYVPKIFRWK